MEAAGAGSGRKEVRMANKTRAMSGFDVDSRSIPEEAEVAGNLSRASSLLELAASDSLL